VANWSTTKAADNPRSLNRELQLRERIDALRDERDALRVQRDFLWRALYLHAGRIPAAVVVPADRSYRLNEGPA
jgi:hypothetical protein